MRIYEELFIVKPGLPEEEIDALCAQMQGVIESAGGKVDKIDKWGTRQLAYRVQKFAEGYYILIHFSAGPATIKELERRLHVADSVIKFITVRMDEKLKWMEKRKKARAERAARKPPPPVPAPPAPAAAPGSPDAPAMPGAPAQSADAPAEPAPASESPTE